MATIRDFAAGKTVVTSLVVERAGRFDDQEGGHQSVVRLIGQGKTTALWYPATARAASGLRVGQLVKARCTIVQQNEAGAFDGATTIIDVKEFIA